MRQFLYEYSFLRLEQQYPGSFAQPIAGHVPACAANGNWGDVSFDNALDMATGNYARQQNVTDTGGWVITEPKPNNFFSSEALAGGGVR